MKKYLYLMMVIFILTNCKKSAPTLEPEGAEVIELTKSTGIPLSRLSVQFREDFIDNRNAWTLQASNPNYTFTIGISGGVYNLNNLSIGAVLGSSSNINFDQSKNWEIETKISCDSRTFGFVWNSNPGRLNNVMLFNPNTVDIIEVDQITNISTIITSKSVKQLAQNTIKIRRVEDRYYFFINENLIYEGSYFLPKGKISGYYSLTAGSLQAEYLQVSYIK